MTYGGCWEQLKSGATTHLPYRAGHDWMHTAEAGLAWRTNVLHAFLLGFADFLRLYKEEDKKTLASHNKIGYNTQVYARNIAQRTLVQ